MARSQPPGKILASCQDLALLGKNLAQELFAGHNSAVGSNGTKLGMTTNGAFGGCSRLSVCPINAAISASVCFLPSSICFCCASICLFSSSISCAVSAILPTTPQNPVVFSRKSGFQMNKITGNQRAQYRHNYKSANNYS